MGLFKILKSVIGLGGSGSRSTSGTAEPGRENVDVTVEHEPDTTSEDAVKGTGDEHATTTANAESTPATETAGETETDSPDSAPEPDAETEEPDAEDSDAEDSDADADTEDAEVETDDAEVETEDAEADTEDAEADTEDAEADTEDAEADTEDAAPDVANADASTDTIKGIGPSYAETLAEIDVETVGDLAAADAADVAEQTDISETRVERWIARARGEDE